MSSHSLSLRDVGARVAGFLAETTRQTVSAHLSAMARQGILERHGRHGLRVYRLDLLEHWRSGAGAPD